MDTEAKMRGEIYSIGNGQEVEFTGDSSEVKGEKHDGYDGGKCSCTDV